VLSRTGLVTPEQFERIVIKDTDGFPVRMRDVARVEVGPQDKRRCARPSSKPRPCACGRSS
jgi:multidrug efflux pump